MCDVDVDCFIWKGTWTSKTRSNLFGGEVKVSLKNSIKPYKTYGYLKFDRGILKGKSFKCEMNVDPRYNILIGTYKIGKIKKITMRMTTNTSIANISKDSIKTIEGEYSGNVDEGTWKITLIDDRTLADPFNEFDGDDLL